MAIICCYSGSANSIWDPCFSQWHPFLMWTEKMSSPNKTPHQSKYIGTGSLQAYCICRGFSCEHLLLPFLSDAITDCLSTPIEDKWCMMTGTRLKHYHPFAWPLRFLMSIMQMSSELELFWRENICNLCCISFVFFFFCNFQDMFQQWNLSQN